MTTREQYEAWFRGFYKQEPMPELGAPAHDFCWAGYKAGRQAEIESLRQQLETERMRNVACDVVAMADTPTSAEEARKMLPDYRSAALESVIRRVDECIALRQRNSDHIKREGMLRDAVKDALSRASMSNNLAEVLEEALAATADLSGVILCHAEPVGYFLKGDDIFDNGFSSRQLNEHWEPLHRAWEPK